MRIRRGIEVVQLDNPLVNIILYNMGGHLAVRVIFASSGPRLV